MKSVYLVDNEKSILDVVEDSLILYGGFSVETFLNATSAWERIRSRAPDCVIIDTSENAIVVHRGQGPHAGLTLSEAIKDKYGSRTVVIGSSGFGRPQDLSGTGYDQFFVKGFYGNNQMFEALKEEGLIE